MRAKSVLGALLLLGVVSCRIDLPSGVGGSDDDDEDDRGGGAACTMEAKVVCVEASAGVFEERAVGRSGPECAFATLPGEVSPALCQGGSGGRACTEDAKRVCVESAPGKYEARYVGRAPETCEFPTLPNTVDDAKCGDGPGYGDQQCKALEAKVELELEALRACDTDADCAVRYGSCPFGCWNYYNPALATDGLDAAMQAFTSASCQSCDYDCVELPAPSELRCKEKRCVSTLD